MTEKKEVRRGIFGFPVGPIRRRLLDILESRAAGFEPAETREEESKSGDELPPEFKPLEKKYGKKMAKAAHDFIENYLDALFE